MASRQDRSRKSPSSRRQRGASSKRRGGRRQNGPGGRSSKKRRRGRSAGPVSPEIQAEILAKVAAGRKAVELAEEYGVHFTTISRWKKKERELAEAQAAGAPREQAAPKAEEPPATPQRVEAPEAPQVLQGDVRETGRYSQAFKEEVLAQIASGRKIVEVAKQYRVPERTIQRWQESTRSSGGDLPEPVSTRPPTNSSPIDEEHRALVLSIKERHPNMGLAQVQNQLKRFHALKLSRHMIARIFCEAGIPLEKRSGRKAEGDPSKNRFEMSRPGELWAVDFKEFWVHSEKAHALFILDDYSRFCLGFALAKTPTADLAIETVNRAIQRYGRPERILPGRGPQFHAWNGVSRFDRFLADFIIEHTVTKANHPFTNGKLESFNRSLEKDLLDVEEFASLGEAEVKIRIHIDHYNFFRTHMGIDGLVPADRFFGMVEEAKKALEKGLEGGGPALSWLQGLVSLEGQALRQPTILQLVLRDGKLELVVLGRRFTLG